MSALCIPVSVPGLARPFLLTPSVSLCLAFSRSCKQIVHECRRIPLFVFRKLRTLSFSVSCNFFACHSYENTGGVRGFFPFWNSSRSFHTPHLAQVLCNVSPFRINTSKSASEQTTLSIFTINTYEKQAGWGRGCVRHARRKITSITSLLHAEFHKAYRFSRLAGAYEFQDPDPAGTASAYHQNAIFAQNSRACNAAMPGFNAIIAPYSRCCDCWCGRPGPVTFPTKKSWNREDA